SLHTPSCLSPYHATPPSHPYPLSLHDALPISRLRPIHRTTSAVAAAGPAAVCHSTHTKRYSRIRNSATRACSSCRRISRTSRRRDRKSTRLNSSHVSISYAVFCLKKKKKITKQVPVMNLQTASTQTTLHA